MSQPAALTNPTRIEAKSAIQIEFLVLAGVEDYSVPSKAIIHKRCLFPNMVGEVGLEPTRLIQPTDFKSVAYTNSATRP